MNVIRETKRPEILKWFGDYSMNVWNEAHNTERLVALPPDIISQPLIQSFATEFLDNTFPDAAEVTINGWFLPTAHGDNAPLTGHGWLIHQASQDNPDNPTIYFIALRKTGLATPLLIVPAQTFQEAQRSNKAQNIIPDGFFTLK